MGEPTQKTVPCPVCGRDSVRVYNTLLAFHLLLPDRIDASSCPGSYKTLEHAERIADEWRRRGK
jgi:hypothetical protein